jgi:hypothetical protein
MHLALKVQGFIPYAETNKNASDGKIIRNNNLNSHSIYAAQQDISNILATNNSNAAFASLQS